MIGVIVALAAIPFVGIALLLWKGPRSRAAVRFHEDIEAHRQTRAELERLRLRLDESVKRLRASQERLAAAAAIRAECPRTRRRIQRRTSLDQISVL